MPVRKTLLFRMRQSCDDTRPVPLALFLGLEAGPRSRPHTHMEDCHWETGSLRTLHSLSATGAISISLTPSGV